MRLDKKRVAGLIDASYGHQMLDEGDRAQAGNPEKEQIWMLLLSEIEPDPTQPRRYFDEVSLQELAADITRRGVLQPILVRPFEDHYRIVFGERRWRASEIAGKVRIPCMVREMDTQTIQQAQIVENILREGISDIERGIGLRNLYETMKEQNKKTTWEQVAQIVGLTRMRINHLYSLSFLPESIIDLIQTKRLSGSHGVELARLEKHPVVQRKLAEEACRQKVGGGAYGLSVAQLRQQVNVHLGIERSPRLPSLSPDQIRERSLELRHSLRLDLTTDTRNHLRDTAQAILLFLEQKEEFVKSTLQIPPDQERETALTTENMKSEMHP